MKEQTKRPILFVLAFYLLCFAFRAAEYLWLRTDQGFLGEAFVHKLVGIALLALALRRLSYRWRDIGFRRDGALRGLGLGLALGLGVYAVAYGLELLTEGGSLRFYAASYAADGNRALDGGLLFVGICLLGNAINVIMEEGVFRGLFLKRAGERLSFWPACLFTSALFGFWHCMQPLRSVLDGEQSVPGALLMGLMLVTTSALSGVQYVLLYRVTGSLWASMAAHFVNNAIINLLHVVTLTGVDEAMSVRITAAQTLSFLIVTGLYTAHRRKTKETTAGA